MNGDKSPKTQGKSRVLRKDTDKSKVVGMIIDILCGDDMRKVKVKRIIKTAIIVLASIFLLCICFCTIAVSRMQILTYNVTGWGVVLTEYKIDFKTNLAERNYYDFDGLLKDKETINLSPAEQKKIKFICTIALMPLWRAEYNNPFILDGDHWNTAINYAVNEKTTYGSNAYPLMYKPVYTAIVELFNKTSGA